MTTRPWAAGLIALLVVIIAWVVVQTTGDNVGVLPETAPAVPSMPPRPLPPDALHWRLHWRVPVTDLATSSPQVAWRRQHGWLTAIGTGRETVTGAVVLLDEDGGVRWRRSVNDEVYTSPRFVRCGDEPRFVVVGGRINDVVGLRIDDGRPAWRLREANPGAVTIDAHFNTSVGLPDLDADGCSDLLVIQSGGNDATRPPGHLMLISGRGGSLLADVVAHDGREWYAVPTVVSVRTDGTVELVVATGGETIPGSVARAEVRPGDHGGLRTRWVAAISAPTGIVASPLLIVDGGRPAEVAAVTFDGVVTVLRLDRGRVIWQAQREGYYVYSSPVAGRFATDGRPGLVTCGFNPSRDRPPGTPGAICDVRSLDDGRPITDIVADDLIISTPLVADITHDGIDDLILVSVRSEPLPQGQGAPVGYDLVSTARLRAIDGATWRELYAQEASGVTGGTPRLFAAGPATAVLLVPFHDELVRLDLSPVPRHIRIGGYRDRNGRVSLQP